MARFLLPATLLLLAAAARGASVHDEDVAVPMMAHAGWPVHALNDDYMSGDEDMGGKVKPGKNKASKKHGHGHGHGAEHDDGHDDGHNDEHGHKHGRYHDKKPMKPMKPMPMPMAMPMPEPMPMPMPSLCPAGCFRRASSCPVECRAQRNCRLVGRNRAGKQRFGFRCVPHVDKACPRGCAGKPSCERRAFARVGAPFDYEQKACRRGSCAPGNLLADALLDRGMALGATAAIVNAGSIRTGLSGRVSDKDLKIMLPFKNDVVIVTVRGSVLLAALENGLRFGAPRFMQIAGMVVKADFSAPEGMRVRGVVLGDAPLEANRVYRIATSTFVARGGDGYMWPGAEVVDANACTTKNVLRDYLKRNAPLEPDMTPRILNTETLV